MSKKKTHQEYLERMKDKHPNTLVLGRYTGALKKVLLRCLVCDYEWAAIPGNSYKGHGCPSCSGVPRINHSQFIEKIKKINPSIHVIGKYIGVDLPIGLRCSICNHGWSASYSSLKTGSGCPYCAGRPKITHNDYVLKMNDLHKNIKIEGQYINSHTPIDVKCLICSHRWKAHYTSSIHQKSGCPYCAGKTKTHDQYIKEMADKFPGTQVLGAYTGIHNPIEHKCLVCNTIWECSPNNSVNHGHGCPCCQKYTDNDAIYIWSTGQPFQGRMVYKFGVTSARLDDQRIKQVAKKWGFDNFEVIIIQKTNGPASKIEAQLLRLGTDPEWTGFDGASEMRALYEFELEKALNIIHTNSKNKHQLSIVK